ncbi:type II secretion system F family protein [Methanolobus profundi]|uniref:Flagellar protein FlaJ n=1 Tax=Methanolobus profundi TaxID=487685 RepID=A0A1I4PGD4_9EURY|nr:type II secretion system F family protein [Methanolobus profundi]SFM26778.1 flagellar protein FlaJ [Methanolobus profundi]
MHNSLIDLGFVRRYAKKRSEKYYFLINSLRAARMDIHYSTYVEQGSLYAIQTYAVVLVSLFLMRFLIDVPIFEILRTYRSLIFSDLTYILLPVISAYIVYWSYLQYPRFVAYSRATKIDVLLPHASSFCYGMTKGGTPIYETIKELAENPHIYGEIATEALYIVRDVELLGNDLVNAVKNTARTTPSKTFHDFLENLVPMIQGGSDIHQYFAVKTEQYFLHAKKTQEMFIKTLEIISEVYVVAFVAVPIFLLITLVTIGLLNLSQTSYLFHSLYIGLPLGSIALIVLIDSISPKEELGIHYVNRETERRSHSMEEEEIDEENYESNLKNYNNKKLKRKIIAKLKNPLAPILQKPLYAFAFSIPLMALPFLLTSFDLNKQIVLSIIIAILPVSLAHEYKMRKLAKLDKAVPDFLRRLAEVNEMGIPVNHAISLLLRSDVGLLSGEIKRVWLDMEWGGEMKDALSRFENRIGTPALRRAVTLLVKATEVSDDTRDVLLIAAEDTENMLKLRDDRFNTGFIYLATVYIAFGTFMYVCYSFSTQFIPSMSGIGGDGMLNVDQITSTMFNTCGILGFFSGLILGEMAHGNLLSGLKHSVILLVLSFACFTILMNY